jgi:hypothetical protein
MILLIIELTVKRSDQELCLAELVVDQQTVLAKHLTLHKPCGNNKKD